MADSFIQTYLRGLPQAVRLTGVGDTLRVRVYLVDGESLPTEPTELTLRVKPPTDDESTWTLDGGEGAGTLVLDSTGNYHADITLTEGGVWWFRAEASRTVVGEGEEPDSTTTDADEHRITVPESGFPVPEEEPAPEP